MVIILALMVVVVAAAAACGFMLIRNWLDSKRRARMTRYAAVFDAGSAQECLIAFKQVLEHLAREEAGRQQAGKNASTRLPDTYEECYTKFQYHFLPGMKKSQSKLMLLVTLTPLMVLFPLTEFTASLGGSGSWYLATIVWLFTGVTMAITFRVLFQRLIYPGIAEEQKMLNQLESKVALALKGKYSSDSPSPISPKDINPDVTDELLSSNVPPWVAALVIGMVLLLVATIFIYGIYSWKEFEVGLLPGYEYLNRAPYTTVETLLKRRDPEEKLHNLFVEETSASHLVASSFKPPSDCVFCELPETKDVAEVEAFIQGNRDELIAAVSSLEMKASTIKALPLACGYVAVQISGKGPDIISGKTGTMEQVIFKRGKTCYRIVIMDGNSGDLASEVQDVAVKTRFK